MTPDGLITVMTVSVVLSAIAMIAMAAMVYGMFKSIRALQGQVSIFLPKAEGFIESTEKALVENQTQIKEITARAITVLDTTQKQLVRVDGFVEDTTNRARVQMDRLEMVLDDTVGRVHTTVVTLNDGILKPLREFNALAAGIRAALFHFFRSSKRGIVHITSDEEMFI
jgi:hypothetical protein